MDKKKLIVILSFIFLLLLSMLAVALVVDRFVGDLSSSGNITFSGNETLNKTISIPRYVNINDAYINISGVGNFENATVTNLKDTDPENWAGNFGELYNGMRAVSYDSNNNLIYTISGATYSGPGPINTYKLGVYNISSNIWNNLNNSNISEWMGEKGIHFLDYDNKRNIVYISGENGLFGYYNITSKTIRDLSETCFLESLSKCDIGSVSSMKYDEFNDLVYIGDRFSNKLYIYNATNISTILVYSSSTANTNSFDSFDIDNSTGLVYFVTHYYTDYSYSLVSFNSSSNTFTSIHNFSNEDSFYNAISYNSDNGIFYIAVFMNQLEIYSYNATSNQLINLSYSHDFEPDRQDVYTEMANNGVFYFGGVGYLYSYNILENKLYNLNYLLGYNILFDLEHDNNNYTYFAAHNMGFLKIKYPTHPSSVSIVINNTNILNLKDAELSGTTATLRKLNDSTTSKNLTFTGNQNQTVYLDIPKFANVTSASLDLSGYNSTSYPSDVTLQIGTPDLTYEFNQTGTFNVTNTTSDFSSIINSYISACSYDFELLCSVPLQLHSDNSGVIGISNISVVYNNISKSRNFSDTLTTALNSGACDCSGCEINEQNCSINTSFFSSSAGVLDYSLTIDYNHTNPNIVLINPSNNTFSTNYSQNFSANISDDMGLKNTTLFIYNASGLVYNTTTLLGGVLQITIGSTITLTEGIFTWFYEAFDIYNNYYVTENRTLTLSSTVITECKTLSLAGVYTLTNNISSSGDCMIIASDNITINGDGYSITGNINASANGESGGVGNPGYTNLVLNNLTIIGNISSNGASGTTTGGNGGNINLTSSIIQSNFINSSGASGTTTGGNGGNITIIESKMSLETKIYLSKGIGATNGTNEYLSLQNSTIFNNNGSILFISASTNNTILSEILIINNNNATVNSQTYPEFNVSSTVNLTNIGTFSNPKILRDGIVCFNCINYTSLSLENVSFGVTSWSSYSIGNGTLNYTLNPDNNSINLTSNTQNLTINFTGNTPINNITLKIYNSTSLVNSTNILTGNVVSSVSGIVITLVDNIYTWFYELFDDSGIKYTTVNQTLIIDTTVPQVNFVANTPDNNSFAQQNFNISVNVTENNLKEIKFNITGNNNVNFYDSSINGTNNKLCYQESANTSNQTGIDGDSNCHLNYSGNYSWQLGGLTGSVSDAFDGDWRTAIVTSVFGHNYVYINYTKPSMRTDGAIFRVGSDGGGGNTEYSNLTIPDSCFNYNQEKLLVYVDSIGGGHSEFACYNGSWVILKADPGASVYEEAIYWNVSYNITTSGNNYSVEYTNVSDGTYHVNVTVLDYVNRTISIDRTILIDSTNPLIAFTTGTLANNSNVSQNFIFANVSLTELNLKNITYDLYRDATLVNSTTYNNLVTSITWINLADSYNYSYLVNVSDWAGNTNATQRRYITLDNNNPNISLVSPANNTILNNATQNLTFNFTDSLSLRRADIYLYNSTGLYNSTSVNFVLGTTTQIVGFFNYLADGAYSWFANVYDLVQNSYLSDTRIFNIDATYPQISFTELTQPGNVNKTDSSIYLDISLIESNFNNITYYLYNSTSLVESYNYETQMTTLEFINLRDVDYWFNVTSCDTANNCNSTETRHVFIDATYPTISFGTGMSENNSLNTQDFIFINTTSEETNFKNITYNLYNYSNELINTTTYTTLINSINYSITTEGYYYSNVTMCDILNQCASTDTYKIGVGTIPTINFLESSSNGTLYNTRKVHFSVYFDVSDFKSINFKVYNETGLFANSSFNYEVTETDIDGLEAGNHTLEVTVCSQLDFCSTTELRNVTIASPGFKILVPAFNTRFISSEQVDVFAINIKHDINKSAVDKCWYNIQNTSSPLESSINNTFLTNCENFTVNLNSPLSNDTTYYYRVNLFANDSLGLVGTTYSDFAIGQALPYIPPAGGGGGGGVIVVGMTNETKWTIETVEGANQYEVNLLPGTEKERTLAFENLGTTERTIRLYCEDVQGDYCQYVNFSIREFKLPVQQGIKVTQTFVIVTPDVITNKSGVIFNIIAEDELKNKGAVTVVGRFDFNLLVEAGTKLTSSKNIAGIYFPYIFIFLFVWAITGVLTYYLVFRNLPRVKAGGFYSVLIGFIVAMSALVLEDNIINIFKN